MVMRQHLDDAGRARIAAAVAEAETRTSAEIRLVLAECSGHYGLFALIYPALAALIAGGVASAFEPRIAGWMLFVGQAVVFAVTAVILQWRPLRLALVPRTVKREAAWRHARLHYASIGLKQPHIKSAVLLFCSEAERSVEILADDAIAEALPPAVWEPVVEAFKMQFAAGKVADAFVGAAHACAAILAPKFPAVEGQRNEISDDLVEL